mgnify:CR=1 FL=1
MRSDDLHESRLRHQPTKLGAARSIPDGLGHPPRAGRSEERPGIGTQVISRGSAPWRGATTRCHPLRPPTNPRARPAGRRVEPRALEHDLAVARVHDDRLAGAELLPQELLDSGSSTSRWIVRRSGRAPSEGSNPFSARTSLAASVSSISRSLAFSCSVTRFISRSTICLTSALGERVEDDDLVDPVQELGPERLLELVHDPVLHLLVGHLLVRTRREADAGSLLDVPGPEVRGHDDDRVLEVHLVTLRVRQAPVLQDLQERVEHVRVRLLDLVEQDHAERLAANGLGELAALLVPHVAGGEPIRRLTVCFSMYSDMSSWISAASSPNRNSASALRARSSRRPRARGR